MAFSDEDFRALIGALRRYADEDMDQFDHLRIEGRFGPIFVAITRALGPDQPESIYRSVSD